MIFIKLEILTVTNANVSGLKPEARDIKISDPLTHFLKTVPFLGSKSHSEAFSKSLKNVFYSNRFPFLSQIISFGYHFFYDTYVLRHEF